MENVVSNIKAFREVRGITRNQLASKCGLTMAYIQQIEKGIKTPSLNVLKSIYRALGIKLTLTYEAIVEEDDKCQ